MDALAPLHALEARSEVLHTRAGKAFMIWRSWGEGAPIVLLHGGHGSWSHWICNIPALARRRRVFAPDIPGFGESPPVSFDAMEPLAAILVAGLRQAIPYDRFHLAGFSFGAIVAGYMLEELGPRVRRLFLVGSAGLGRFNSVTERLKRWRDARDYAARAAIHRHNLAELMIADATRIDDLAVALQTHNSERATANFRRAAAAANLRNRIARSSTPVSGLFGGRDALMMGYLEERRTFIETRPNSDLSVVPHAGHWVQYEAPDEVNAWMGSRVTRDIEVEMSSAR